MPSIRVGFSTDLNIRGGKVGFGTTNLTADLEVAGQITAERAAGSGGVSTFREYQGFSQSEARISNNVTIDNSDGGPFSSLTGEIKITGETTVSSGSTVEVGKTKTLTATDRFSVPLGDTNDRDNTPEPGTTRFNQDFGTLEFFDGVNWKTVNSYARYYGGSAGRGVFGGGNAPGSNDEIDYINIHTLGNAVDFGVLTVARRNFGACSSSIRGLFAGGYNPTFTNVIEYITISSEGDSIDFGDLATNATSSTLRMGNRGCSSSTRGIFAGGYHDTPAATNLNIIDYVEISTIGSAKDFGDLSETRRNAKGFVSSPTRGVYAGGVNPAFHSDMDFITISSTGNAVNFGEIRVPTNNGTNGNISSGVRGIFGTGFAPALSNGIECITISSTGNSTDFGGLSGSTSAGGGGSNSTITRGIISGFATPAATNIIHYITIATAGDSIDFGDLSVTRNNFPGLSDSHGGLGGF